MTPSQTYLRFQPFEASSNRWLLNYIASMALLAFGVSTPYLPAVAAGTSIGSGLQATPLVLKDGRIARVSIHTVPFPEDAAALASITATELQIFTQAMATDCFLTAQVIGHVDKAETDGRDTVDIHRLARARADTIQDTLIANGLPAASIASVWDWQFMVQDARATLWVFQLAAGDDCTDEALSPASSEQVASLNDEIATKAVEQQTVDLKKTASQEVQQRVIAAAKTTAAEVTKPIPASVPESKKAAGGNQKIKQAVAPAPKTSKPVQLTAAKATDQDIDDKGRVVVSEEGALEITFATNSSYLPQGWSSQLQAFLDRLDEGKSYVARVQTSIDSSASVTGTSSEDEAARYNQWLADRRFERVKAWLLKSSKGSELQIEPIDINDDGSKRVIVELNPLG